MFDIMKRKDEILTQWMNNDLSSEDLIDMIVDLEEKQIALQEQSAKKQHPIKDGDVREATNSVAIVVGVWQDGDQIMLKSKDAFISSVNDNEGSKRQHRNLYKQLKVLLQNHGKWTE